MDKSKKNMNIKFDLAIPRQKRAYEILMNEKAETGIPHNLVVHEALELWYAMKHQVEISESDVMKEPGSTGKKKKKKVPDITESVSEAVESSYELTEDELDDPYLLEQLGALYSDEQ